MKEETRKQIKERNIFNAFDNPKEFIVKVKRERERESV